MAVGEHGFDPDFEWWYSEGEAPDEEWDEPAPRDVLSDEDETGNDAVETDAASDSAPRPPSLLRGPSSQSTSHGERSTQP